MRSRRHGNGMVREDQVQPHTGRWRCKYRIQTISAMSQRPATLASVKCEKLLPDEFWRASNKKGLEYLAATVFPGHGRLRARCARA